MQKRRRTRGNQTAYQVAKIFAILIVISGIAAVALLMIDWKKDQNKAIEALNQTMDAMYTEDEVHTMVAGAKEEAANEAATSTREQMLADFKLKLSQGESAVSVLRPLYPTDIVVISNGVYNFVPINENITKHNYNLENLVVDEEGKFTYTEDGEVVSHKGIDVSKYQGKINWKKVKADGVEYAFLRLGLRGYETGKLAVDDTFVTNIEGALEAGVEVGVYFFSQAITQAEAIEEAEFVLEQLEPYKITYPVVFDVEKVGSEKSRMNAITVEERTAATIAFCERIKQAGLTPMIYGNMEMFSLLVDLEQLEQYDKWYAYYDASFYYPYDFKFWQYTEKGSVDGIKGNVDLNIRLK